MNKTQNINKIILASASPRRRQLMQEAGYNFEIIVSSAEEIQISNPIELVRINAENKAKDVARKNPNRLVLGSDTIVAFAEKVLGKPKDLTEAFDMLKMLQGNSHSVYTGVSFAMFDGQKFSTKTDVQESKVIFKKLSDANIKNYLQKVNVLDKAGAYAAQECGELIIEKIDGDFDNVMGLPMRLVKNLLDTLQK